MTALAIAVLAALGPARLAGAQEPPDAGAPPSEPAPAEVPDQPTAVPAEPAPAAPSGEVPPAAEQPGRIQLVLFAGRGMRLVDGAVVTVVGGESAVTGKRGSVYLRARAGTHAIRIQIAPGGLPTARGAEQIELELTDVRVVAGDVTRVLVTTDERGELRDKDVLVPEAAAPPPSAAGEQQAAPGTAAGPTGTLSGRVVSTGGDPIAGVKLYVIGVAAEGETDKDGRYSIALPEGVYSLSIVHLDYTGQTLENVVITQGATRELAITLAPAPVEVEDYVVRGRRIRGSVATVMEERRESASVTDAIGAEDIRKSPDGTASAATRRVVGATVVGGQYLFVRGLGGRYSNVRLNGVPMPSTDPDVPGFQLDLFPASLLSSLTIVKTFTPDIPGDFAGGSMNIVTRDFPDKFDLTASLSVQSDTQTLGRDVQTYDGGDLDFLGFDDGARALPDAVPEDAQVSTVPQFGDPSPDDRIAEIGRAFPNHWELDTRAPLPSLGLGFSIGNTSRLGDNRFGYLFTLGYRYATSRYVERINNPTLAPEGSESAVMPRETLRREAGKESAQIGLLGTASYELAKGHDLTLVSLLTQTGDDEASRVAGFGESEGGNIRQTELTFIERQLLFNQLLGAHDLTDLVLDWQLNMALVQREQPDSRGLIYVESPVMPGQFLFSQTSGSGERFYLELSQADFGGGANLTIPLGKAQLKSGYLGRSSDRDVTGRRFETTVPRSRDRLLDPEELFTPESSGDIWRLNELTKPEDGYAAEQELHAGYGLADVPVTSWLRLTGGARVESFRQAVAVTPPLPPIEEDDLELAASERTDTDGLPAGAAILGLSDSMSVRLAYGGTVARPVVRELAPFVVTDFVRRRTVTGNIDLKRTYIHNFDLRWELFPSATEVLAASVFYKIFIDPIEAVVQDTRGNLTFDNIDSARNYGVELETRLGLQRLAGALEAFVLTANFAWIQSSITLRDDQVMNATSQERPLAGQSPYVVNLSLGFSPGDTGLSLNLFYNVFGRRISEVGRNRLPDAYEEPFHSLDFTASYQLAEHWTLGASATNLLLQESVVEQGGLEVSRLDRGTSFAVRLGFAN